MLAGTGGGVVILGNAVAQRVVQPAPGYWQRGIGSRLRRRQGHVDRLLVRLAGVGVRPVVRAEILLEIGRRLRVGRVHLRQPNLSANLRQLVAAAGEILGGVGPNESLRAFQLQTVLVGTQVLDAKAAQVLVR